MKEEKFDPTMFFEGSEIPPPLFYESDEVAEAQSEIENYKIKLIQ